MKEYVVGEELMDFSLLRCTDNVNIMKINEKAIFDLGLTAVFDAAIEDKTQREYIIKKIGTLSIDKADIKYRQDIFDDLFSNNEMLSNLVKALEALKTLAEFQRSRVVDPDRKSMWYLVNYLRELEVYIDAIEALGEALRCDIKSVGLIKLRSIIDEIRKSSGFDALKKDITRLTDDVSKIKSLSLGVNLDENLNATEVILTSVNEEVIPVNSTILDGFMEFVYQSAAESLGDFNVMHSLKKGMANERDSIMLDLTQNIEKALKDMVSKLTKILGQYVNTKGYQVLDIVDELRMYINLVSIFKSLNDAGYKTILPCIHDGHRMEHDVSGSKIDEHIGKCNNVEDTIHSLSIKNVYNLRLALSMLDKESDMICNDVDFNNDKSIYILTGPNRGGKTILTQAVGQAVVLMNIGCYVPASSMEGDVISGIYTHFPADENDTLSYGRLGEEAMRINEIIKEADSSSLLLLNETYATTSFSDGHYMAKDLVRFLKYQNIKCIYNTHIHELASDVDELNSLVGDGKAVSLVMGIDGGKRLYKAEIRKPDNNSFAKDIAIKYGVTYEQMMKSIEDR